MGLTLNSSSLTLEAAGGGGGGAAGLSTADVNTLIKNSTPYQHIATLEASDSASLDFDDIPAYSSYKVIFDGLMPTSSTAYSDMRLYKVVGTPHTVSDYKWNVQYSKTSQSWGQTSDTSFKLDGQGNHFQYGLSGELEIAQTPSQPAILRWNLAAGSGSYAIRYDGAGMFYDVAQIVGMQFYPSSSTWQGGKVHLYGVNR
jgi:hypothetical protein